MKFEKAAMGLMLLVLLAPIVGATIAEASRLTNGRRAEVGIGEAKTQEGPKVKKDGNVKYAKDPDPPSKNPPKRKPKVESDTHASPGS